MQYLSLHLSLNFFFQVPGPKFASVDRIKDNQMDLVKLLVTRGGDMSIRDKTGNTPRDFAIQCDFYECVELLDELTS